MSTVVNLLDNENQDARVVSQKWLSADKTHASIPNLDIAKFHRSVKNHETLPDDSPLRPVSILIHTGRLSISRHPEEQPPVTKHEWIQRRSEDSPFPSSEGTVVMGLPPKRIKTKLRYNKHMLIDTERSRKTYPLKQQATGIHAKPNFPLRQIQTIISQGPDELPTIDCVTKLHDVVMQTLRGIQQRLGTVEYKVSFGASDYALSLSTLDETKDFDRNLYKESDRKKLDSLLAPSIGVDAGNYIQSLMPRLLRKQATLEVNYAGDHSKYAFRRTALSDFIVGMSPMFFYLFDKRLVVSTKSVQ
ncbi:hypothetical protein FGIG_00911 [Fasciola gigantica]|uniref:Uncharacterized protein n=1 Tax=Fasciola gigantica TaxID=46835 RepID=A0A504YLP1_FASGI|nr:hypothetical protein FGIG_00911 [Fasciola gigantica]